MNVLTYEQLKQQLESREREVMALNVKNDKLIEAMRAIYTAGFLPIESSHGDANYFWDYTLSPQEQIEQWITEAKSTDATLANQQAIGVEKAIEHLHCAISPTPDAITIVGVLNDFAKQLRGTSHDSI
ncbi:MULTISPECIES: hypothetical protein [unclassified Serratia (in: enterobacteria)]|uniref:hypothetical protein n=1 Tax=unclassified Serratia (in: enterobacteria) TaxID=2647522 RepID=UPI000467F3A3|nr:MULTISPECIES: hypothetical protein [unclassified Serratia (in: enterobacteria)]